MSIEIFKNLNKAQLKSVQHIEGPLLILAGAGTGKTKVLVSRIANLLLNNNATSSQIMAVTFTNKAANEMKFKINNIVANDTSEMLIGTFHAIALQMVKKFKTFLPFISNEDLIILNTEEQIKIVKKIIKELNIDEQKLSPKYVITQISKWKDQGLKAGDINDNNNLELHNLILNIYREYQKKLQNLNALDFGDLLLYSVELLKNNKNILEYYHQKIHYILVDEYQDTNTIQYLWLKLLAQGHNNICCVGDDDQSIYGWRGAKLENILKFEKDFIGAKIIKLEENYRSTNHILNLASSLIKNNKRRHDKTLFTSRKSDKKVKLISCWNESSEAKYIASEITLLFQQQNLYNENAILLRASFQTRSFEEAFIRNSIPYVIIGGLKFYDRKEIKDITAYIRLTISQNDDLAFERIINTPKRGIGSSTLLNITSYSNNNHIPLLEAAKQMLKQNLFSKKISTEITNLITLLSKWRDEFTHINHKEVVKNLIQESGYKEMLENDKNIEIQSKIENLQEFLIALEEFDNIKEFLEHIGLVNDLDQDTNEDAVNIITLHSSKGLEFKNVFLAGWEEGIFPHQKTIEEQGESGIEEERRLAYVGITRAKENLYISYATNRKIFNQWQKSIPSRFIKELSIESIENLTSNNSTYSQSTPLKSVRKKIIYNNKFDINTQILHNKFGIGTVKSIIGDVIEVNFQNGKTRFVIASTVTAA